MYFSAPLLFRTRKNSHFSFFSLSARSEYALQSFEWLRTAGRELSAYSGTGVLFSTTDIQCAISRVRRISAVDATIVGQATFHPHGHSAIVRTFVALHLFGCAVSAVERRK